MGAAEPGGEVEVEIAVAVGGAGVAHAKASGKGGGIGLVGGVAVKGGSGAVFNEDFGTTTTGGGMISDVDTFFVVGIEDGAVI